MANLAGQMWQNRSVGKRESVEMSSFAFCFKKVEVKSKKNARRYSFPYSFSPTRRRVCETTSSAPRRFSQSEDRIRGSPVKSSVEFELQKWQQETRNGIFGQKW